MPMDRRSPAGPSGFRGSQVLWVGLLGGAGGLMVGLFLRTIVARTPTSLPDYALFWLLLVLGVMGALAGMAVEAVRQLQSGSPDPAYHHSRQQQQRLAQERLLRREQPGGAPPADGDDRAAGG
jgi:hypothetical protein